MNKNILFALFLAAGAYQAPVAQADETPAFDEQSLDLVADRRGNGPGRGPGFGGPGRPGPGPGHNPGRGPGFGGPGRPGPGPGHNPGRPGHNPGRPGWNNPGRPGPGPGWNNPGHRPPHRPGWNRPGWRPGRGWDGGWRPGPRPGFRPGWGHNRGWGRPIYWRPARRVVFPPIFIPIPMPSEGYMSLCEGNFVGGFSGDRDAYLALRTDGFNLDGQLTLTDPEASYRVSGTCNDDGDGTAEVTMNLNGGAPYVGQIYVADDGEVYFEGQQGRIEFALKRQ